MRVWARTVVDMRLSPARMVAVGVWVIWSARFGPDSEKIRGLSAGETWLRNIFRAWRPLEVMMIWVCVNFSM